MITYKNLSIIGTSHISLESVNNVKSFISTNKPEIIALEIDRPRLLALLEKGKKKFSLSDIKDFGFKGFLFNLIGAWIEKKLGKLVGVSPGAEMKIAVELAKKNKINIALIDQDIKTTLKRLSISITFKEKMNILIDLFKSIILKKTDIKFDITKVPDQTLITKILDLVKKRYPSFYKVLIEERNTVMAKNLNKIINDNKDKKVLAIIGAGHLQGVLKSLKSYDENQIY